jgi:hypothetical protein
MGQFPCDGQLFRNRVREGLPTIRQGVRGRNRRLTNLIKADPILLDRSSSPWL